VTFVIPRKLLLLIGMNGSGKTSVLQALGFIREFAEGNAEKFFDDRGWLKREVKTQIRDSSTLIRVDLLLSSEDDEKFLWQFNWGLNSGRTVRETIWVLEKDADTPKRIINFTNRALDTGEDDKELSVRGVELKGSVLSLIRTRTHSADRVRRLAEWATGITSLELLSPTAMRGGARGLHHDIGNRGEHLSSFLAGMDSSAKSRIVDRLSEFYPLERIETTRKRAGWVDLQVAESFKGVGNIGATHLSDGFLRLLALCAIPELQNNPTLVLLDEIEDGIEPHILPSIVKRVISDASVQFVLTSHSPLLVNFIENDEVALLGRSEVGNVIASPIARLGRIKSGLEYFGSGELWAMLDRTSLQQDLVDNLDEGLSERTNTLLHRYHPRVVTDFMRDS
jgi:ABC-type branched-subunit amino acid transport system ATPase component